MQPKSSNRISPTVIILGLVSFFNDFASEMVYPVIPIFLTSFLGVPVTFLGLIEGIAEATASILKVFSGYFSDRFGKRKIFVVVGYSFSTISKVVIGLASGWPLVLVGRFVDRFGKGVRTSARDALISENTTAENKGRSFGFHRMLDTAGAVVGPLAAILLIHFYGNNLRPIFYIAFIPGFIGVILLILLVKEKRKDIIKKAAVKLSFSSLNSQLKFFILISVIFALGNSSDTFLILQAKNLGLTTIAAILAYVVYNFVYAATSLPAGIVSDKIGPRKVLIAGFLIFALVYFLFGFSKNSAVIWFLFAAYGLYIAFTDGVGKAYISQLAKENIATSFGIYQTLTGVASFFASLVAGILWVKVSPSATFYYGAIAALLAAILFSVVFKRKGIGI